MAMVELHVVTETALRLMDVHSLSEIMSIGLLLHAVCSLSIRSWQNGEGGGHNFPTVHGGEPLLLYDIT